MMGCGRSDKILFSLGSVPVRCRSVRSLLQCCLQSQASGCRQRQVCRSPVVVSTFYQFTTAIQRRLRVKCKRYKLSVFQGLITVTPAAVLIKSDISGAMPVVASAYNNASDPSQRRSSFATVCCTGAHLYLIIAAEAV
jgi:hypothetical protein